MTSQQTRSSAPLRNAFYELALAKQMPDAELLDEFVQRYPEYATELTEFAIELAVDAAVIAAETETEPASIGDSMAVSKAMSRFHNRLYAVRREGSLQGKQPAVPVENPFLSLNKAELRSLGQRLRANTVFLMKLRDRQIDAKTMTDGFQKRVAEELQVPVSVMATHCMGPMEIQAGIHFKANEKPTVGPKQTFEEAVRSSGLTPEQEKYLLSL
jgi:hypothetical protein